MNIEIFAEMKGFSPACLLFWKFYMREWYSSGRKWRVYIKIGASLSHHGMFRDEAYERL